MKHSQCIVCKVDCISKRGTKKYCGSRCEYAYNYGAAFNNLHRIYDKEGIKEPTRKTKGQIPLIKISYNFNKG